MTKSELRNEIRDAKKIANDLKYPEEVKQKLDNAMSVNEIDRILRSARLKCK